MRAQDLLLHALPGLPTLLLEYRILEDAASTCLSATMSTRLFMTADVFGTFNIILAELPVSGATRKAALEWEAVSEKGELSWEWQWQVKSSL